MDIVSDRGLCRVMIPAALSIAAKTGPAPSHYKDMSASLVPAAQMDRKPWNVLAEEEDVESIEMVGRGAFGDVFKVLPVFGNDKLKSR